MTKKEIIKFLKERLDIMIKANNKAIFPPYDTGYVKYTENKINEIMAIDKEEIEKIPVAACRYCNSLYILNDEIGNDHCVGCGSVNEVKIYKTMEEYLDLNNTEEEDE